MKINWGTSIVIAIVCFMGFIMFMVVKMMTNDAYNHDFVTDKYYQKELAYQNNINAIKNVRALGMPITIDKISTGLIVKFPSLIDIKEIKGNVFLYRPSNKALDFEMPISKTDTYLLVPEERLLGGRWNIDIHFTYRGKTYLHQQEIMY